MEMGRRLAQAAQVANLLRCPSPLAAPIAQRGGLHLDPALQTVNLAWLVRTSTTMGPPFAIYASQERPKLRLPLSLALNAMSASSALSAVRPNARHAMLAFSITS